VGDAITDTLLYTLADIDGHADVTFDLDSAIRVLEAAQAGLEEASADEKRHVVERARALAAKSTTHAETKAFFAALIESLTDEAHVDG
jgi:hypothetical protein